MKTPKNWLEALKDILIARNLQAPPEAPPPLPYRRDRLRHEPSLLRAHTEQSTPLQIEGRLRANVALRYAVENPRSVRHRRGRIVWRINLRGG